MVAFDCLVDKMKNEETFESTDEVAIGQLKSLSQLIANAI
jgi:cell division protein ZapA